MGIKGDLILVGVLGAGAYLVVTNAGKISGWLGDQIGKGLVQPTQESIDKLYKDVAQSGADTGKALRDWLDSLKGIDNKENLAAPANAPPTQETIDMLKKVGQYYDPVVGGFLPVGYQPDPTDPFHKPLVKTSDIYAAVQQKFIAAGAVSSLLGNAYQAGGSPPASPSPIDSPSALFNYQGNTYAVVTSNLGTQAIQIDNMTIPIENLSNIATPEQKASYVPQGTLDHRFSNLTDAQIRNIPNTPFGFSRAEHYSAAAWTEINNTLAAYYGL